MCRLPVTFGGGMTMVKVGRVLDGSAVKAPVDSHLA